MGGLVLTGHQPAYLPWVPYFTRMLEADVFVLLDHVQYEQRGWQNRNRIRTTHGELLLTVPIRTRGRSRQRIDQAEIDTAQRWQRRHWASITHAYRSAPHFDRYREALEHIYLDQQWRRLVDLDLALTHLIMDWLHIDTPIVRSSMLGLTSSKTGLLVEICERLNATTLLTGEGAATYIDPALLAAHGITHHEAQLEHPRYVQRHRPFLPGMSAIDLLFNCGGRATDIVQIAERDNHRP